MPLVGGSTPVSTLMSVDLPAPLSPISPTISLEPISSVTFLRLTTLPYFLPTFSSRTIGAGHVRVQFASGRSCGVGPRRQSIADAGLHQRGDRIDIVLGDEAAAGVQFSPARPYFFCRTAATTGIEALQIGLLVENDGDVAVLQRLNGGAEMSKPVA